jgi:periplasmic protein TonB
MMTHAVANSMDPFGGTQREDLSLRQFLIYSVIMHASLAVVIVVSAFIQFRENRWGGIGGDLGGTKVNLVSAAGIPMPKESVVTESKAVDPTKGLYKEEPPKPPEPKTDATKIPKFEKEKPLPPSRPSRTLDSKTPPPDNAVPYGKGGNPDLPTGYSPTPGGGSSGASIQGQGSTDFATRYGWYIAAAKRRVAPNWNLLFLDPAARNSRTLHCVISFTILRDGTVKNLRVEQSSGNSSWDTSGLRAIQSSSPFPPLPSDWTARDVSVLWDFPDKENP